ncbi:hypothetical protein RUND412_007001 [Rhizina undulata]
MSTRRHLRRRVSGPVDSIGSSLKSGPAAKERNTVTSTPADPDPSKPSTITDVTGLKFTSEQQLAIKFSKVFNQARKPDLIMNKFYNLKSTPSGLEKFLADNPSEGEEEE